MKIRQIGVSLITSCSLLLLMVSAVPLEAYFKSTLNTTEKLKEIGQLTTEVCSLRPKQKRFTLVHFWASYDAESRAKNIQWNNFFAQSLSDKISYKAISLDPDLDIYNRILMIDGINSSTQFCVKEERRSEVLGRYALEKAMHSYLIDEDGTICLIDPKAEELNYFYHL